jgi:hypothetical protein
MRDMDGFWNRPLLALYAEGLQARGLSPSMALFVCINLMGWSLVIIAACGHRRVIPMETAQVYVICLLSSWLPIGFAPLLPVAFAVQCFYLLARDVIRRQRGLGSFVTSSNSGHQYPSAMISNDVVHTNILEPHVTLRERLG